MYSVIALVGCPNVGKSTLFNRLTKSRDALVASFPGLTRDRQYGRGAVGNCHYMVIDTGGLSGDTDGLDGYMADQSMAAVAEADTVFFIVDGRSGRTAGDEQIAQLLRQRDKNIVLVANKMDGADPDFIRGEFLSLGLGDPHLIAAVNGHGVKSLMDFALVSDATGRETDAARGAVPATLSGIRIAVIGRPNVGKSTLVNRILGEERVVVFDEAGTTRDSIYIPFQRDDRDYVLIDTAGVRRRGKINLAIEKFSVIKALEAMDDSHVVILMIDARDGLVDQDLHLLGHALDSGRGLVVAINKWDGLDFDQKELIRKELNRRLVYLDYVSFHFISALHGSGVGHLFKSIDKSYASATRKLKTPELNKILEKAVARHQPPSAGGRRTKLRYAHLGGSNPPQIVIHGSHTADLPEAYRRYLQNVFIKELKLEGTPVQFLFRSGDNPYAGKKNVLTRRQKVKRQRLMKHVKKVARKKR